MHREYGDLVYIFLLFDDNLNFLNYQDERVFNKFNFILTVITICIVLIVLEEIERDYINMREKYDDKDWYRKWNASHNFSRVQITKINDTTFSYDVDYNETLQREKDDKIFEEMEKFRKMFEDIRNKISNTMKNIEKDVDKLARLSVQQGKMDIDWKDDVWPVVDQMSIKK